MNLTRRQWMGTSAVGMLGAMAYGLKLSPIAQALADFRSAQTALVMENDDPRL